jgi:hypothetical protein
VRKKDILNQVSDARHAHATWLRRAKHLIEGLPVQDGMIPIDPTFCTFGKWFYKDGVRLKRFDSLQEVLDKIERLHVELHDVYLNIYKVFFINSKRTWLMSKILAGSYAMPRKKEYDFAKVCYYQLESISREMMQELTTLERIVYLMPETKIQLQEKAS